MQQPAHRTMRWGSLPGSGCRREDQQCVSQGTGIALCRELSQLLQATSAGFRTGEASRRLRLYGRNSLVRESRFAALFGFCGFFTNPEHVSGLIIIAVALFSVAPEFLDGIPDTSGGGFRSRLP